MGKKRCWVHFACSIDLLTGLTVTNSVRSASFVVPISSTSPSGSPAFLSPLSGALFLPFALRSPRHRATPAACRTPTDLCAPPDLYLCKYLVRVVDRFPIIQRIIGRWAMCIFRIHAFYR